MKKKSLKRLKRRTKTLVIAIFALKTSRQIMHLQ
jgi:hypothetical protein